MIEDGKGSGGTAEVRNNKLRTYSIIEEEQAHANEDEGNAFSVVIDRATDGGAQQFFYMKNTGDADLHVTSIKTFVSADTEIKVLLNVTGTATSPATITPVNRNTGSGNVISGTFQTGNDLTMTGGDTVDLIRFDSADGVASKKFSWGSGLILPKNGTLCLESSAAATINMTISCFLHG